MHDDGSTVLDWLAEHRAGGVVHDKRNSHLAADLGDFGDWKNRELRVGQCLAIPAASTHITRLPKVFRVNGIDEAAFDAHAAQGVLEEVPGTAIDVGRADKIIADMTDILHSKQRCGLPRGYR